MDWDAKLNWAEEVYTMLVVLPVPVIFVTGLFFLGPWLHRRSRRKQAVAAPAEIHFSGEPAAGKT